MLDGVLREVAARGRTVVMTSHDLARAGDLASRFDVISRGKVVASVGRTEMPTAKLLGFYRESISSAGTAVPVSSDHSVSRIGM